MKQFFFLIFLLAAGSSYSQMVLKLTKSVGYKIVFDMSTGQPYFLSLDTSALNLYIYNLNNFSEDYSIPFAEFPAGTPKYIIPSINGTSANDMVFDVYVNSYTNSVCIYDLSTHQIVKQWLASSTRGYTSEVIIANNRILLYIQAMSGQYLGSYSDGEIYDVGASSPNGVMDKSQSVNSYSLGQNYPNPFNPGTTIDYTVSKPGISKLNIYDITGKLINSIQQSNVHPRTYHYHWNGLSSSGGKLASGTYIYELEMDNYKQAKKMILLK